MLEKKLYQLIIHRLDGNKLCNLDYVHQITTYVKRGLGGLIIFGGQLETVKAFVQYLQSIAELPLWIASDTERGLQQQLSGATVFAGNMATASAIDLNNHQDLTLLQISLTALADELIYAGINMPLIPILDINSNPDNPIICTRAFSDNAKKVADFGAFYITTLQSKGLIACAKHFPGHGDTDIDSHIALPIINKTHNELISDIYPFEIAVKYGVKSMMAGHIVAKAIDTQPASLSEKVLRDLLRVKLGFKGLIMTDALNMDALSQFEGIEARALQSGVDLLLHPKDIEQSVKYLSDAIAFGDLDEQTIDEAYHRVVEMKRELLFKSSSPHSNIDFTKHEKIASEIIKKSFCVLQDKFKLLPLKYSQSMNVFFFGDAGLYDVSFLKENLKSHPEPADIALICIFTSVNAWKGTSGISHKTKAEILSLIRHYFYKCVITSFGSPYVLRFFKEASTLIAGFEPSLPAQKAFIKYLFMQNGFTGVLPVKLCPDPAIR